jgi:glucokinase
VGGTKSNLALFANGNLLYRRRFATKDYAGSSFEALLADFLKGVGPLAANIRSAAFASAGMLVNGNFQCTNVPWRIRASRLERQLRLKKIMLLNDLEATARSLVHLPARDFLVLNKGAEKKRAPKALLAAGTGLGEAILIWEGSRYCALPSEGGQADFAPRNEKEIELLRFLLKKRPNVCSEDVLSGRGFRRIHEFLGPEVRHSTFDSPEADSASEITRLGLAHKCAVCAETLDMWAQAYGAEAGNLALKVLAFGGVYVAGGIAVKIATKLKDGAFFRAFCDKANKMSAALERIPIRVVMNEDAPLIGAALAAHTANR